MKLYVRGVDTALIAALAAIAAFAYMRDGIWARVTAYALVGIIALVAYVSSGPALWIRTLHLGHNMTSGTSLRHARKTGSKLPCPYPDAWYVVALTDELPPGALKDVTVCNWNLIVWRPQATKENPCPAPVVMDAYCTHLGAHLALGGGRVHDQCVRCPFHGWQFGVDGKVRHVPGSDSVPPHSDIRTWPSQEKNGVVSVWMSSTVHRRQGMSKDADAPAASKVATTECAGSATTCEGRDHGTAQLQAHAAVKEKNKPWFEIPTLPQLNGPSRWTYHGHTENIVNALLFEIPENGSDVAHLPILHREFIIPALGFAFSHIWEASWKGQPSGHNSHIADIKITETIAFLDKPVPGQVHVTITQAGPSQVYLLMRTPVGPLFVVETVTPVAPMRLRVLHALYTPSYVPAVVAKAVLYATMYQFEKDVPVWCNKQYAPRPILSKADPGIATYRRWITQFWNAESITYEDAVRQHVHDELGFPVDSRMDW